MFFYKFIPNTFYILYILYAGTETNVPPEFITDRKYDISKEAVRSIGITIYEMLYGRAPYTDYKKFSDVIYSFFIFISAYIHFWGYYLY